MIVESQAAVFSATSDGTTILARPFINSLTNVPEAAFVAIPSSSSIPGSAGTVTAHASSGNFYEAHLDLTEKITDLGWVRLDTLLGYRFYRYDEGLIIQQTLFPFQRAVTGTKIVNSDNFQTKNEFNGGDFGMRPSSSWETCPWASSASWVSATFTVRWTSRAARWSSFPPPHR